MNILIYYFFIDNNNYFYFMNNFSIIFKIKKLNIKNDKSIFFNSKIKYFIYIFNCDFIILV